MRIKILKKIKSNLEVGKIIKIEDKEGIPTNRFWRARLKDSKIDNCIEIVKIKSKK